MNNLKSAATKLRDDGYSYSFISERLGIAKSTLSNWFRDRPFMPNHDTLQRVKVGQAKYGLARKKQRVQETQTLLDRGLREIGNVSQRDLWMIGLGVWLGEGSKTVEQIRLANSDPAVIKLWLRWLREVCELKDANITARMHLYLDGDEQVCMQYWQAVTGLHTSAFRKTQFDTRSSKATGKKGKLPYGTLHISVIAAGNPEYGVRLYRRMMGWVSAILR